MPIVHVSVWEGMTLENKKKTVEGITKVLWIWRFQKKQLKSLFMKVQRAIGQRVESCIQKNMHTRPPYKH